MSRLPDLTIDDATPAVAGMMRAQQEAFGDVFNATKVLGHCPGIAEAATAMGQSIDAAGNIEPSLRYLLYVRVAGLNGCPF